MFIRRKIPLQDHDLFSSILAGASIRLLRAFKHQKLQHRGVLFMGGLLTFEIADMREHYRIFRMATLAQEIPYQDDSGKQEDGLYIHTAPLELD